MPLKALAEVNFSMDVNVRTLYTTGLAGLEIKLLANTV